MEKDYKDIGERIKEEAIRKFGSVVNLERKLERGEKSLGQYTSGRNKPGNKLLTEFASVGLDIQYIITGTHAEYEKNFLKPRAGHWYRVISSIDAGDPVQIFREENYTGEEVFFPFGSTENCFPLKVVGDSMTSSTGDSIPNGEYVLADLTQTPLQGDVVAISLSGGRQMIKQYIEGPEDSITLRSFNPNYPDIIVKKIDVIKMVRVIGQGHFKRR